MKTILNSITKSIKIRKKNREPKFIADPHFLHSNIIDHCHRPFSSCEEMDEAMVKNWNNKVDPKDDIIILGDLFYKGPAKAMHHVLSQLNGEKILILGNHDYRWLRKSLYKYFVRIEKQLTIEVYDENDGKYQEIFCTHYPHMSWPNAYYGSWCLYGHVHGRYDDRDDLGKQHDVCVESNNYTPVSYNELKTIMKDK